MSPSEPNCTEGWVTERLTVKYTGPSLAVTEETMG